jgi:hypothetical protein
VRLEIKYNQDVELASWRMPMRWEEFVFLAHGHAPGRELFLAHAHVPGGHAPGR